MILCFCDTTLRFLPKTVLLFSESDKREISYYPPKSSCDYGFPATLSPYWTSVDMIMAIVYTFIPSATMLLVNGALLKLVQGKTHYNKSNLVLTVILTAMFLVSYMPFAIR